MNGIRRLWARLSVGLLANEINLLAAGELLFYVIWALRVMSDVCLRIAQPENKIFNAATP